MQRDEIRDYVRRLVDSAPPLNADQRARLALLLRTNRTAVELRREAA